MRLPLLLRNLVHFDTNAVMFILTRDTLNGFANKFFLLLKQLVTCQSPSSCWWHEFGNRPSLANCWGTSPESWLSLGNACFLRSWWRESAECCTCVREVGSRWRQWGAYSADWGRTTFFPENRWVNLVFISGQCSDPNVVTFTGMRFYKLKHWSIFWEIACYLSPT